MTSNSSLYGTPPNQDVSSTNSTSLYGGADTPIPTSDGNIVVRGDLIVLSGNILTTAQTGNIFPQNATTINIGLAATSVNIGADTGTTTINNALVADSADFGNITIAVADDQTITTTSGELRLGSTSGAIQLPGVDTLYTDTNGTFNVLNQPTTVYAFRAATSLLLGEDSGTTDIRNNLTVRGTALNIAQGTDILYSENNDRLNRPNIQSTTGNTSGLRIVAPNATANAVSSLTTISTNDSDNTKFISLQARGSANPLRFQTGQFIGGVQSASGESVAFVDFSNTYATVNPAGPTIGTDLTTKSYVDAIVIDNTTYTIDASTTTGGANFNLVGSNATTDTIKFASGTGIAVSRTNANTITITNTSTGTTYSQNVSTATGGANLNLVGSDATTDTVKFADGTGVTVTRTDANTATIAIGQPVAITDDVAFNSVTTPILNSGGANPLTITGGAVDPSILTVDGGQTTLALNGGLGGDTATLTANSGLLQWNHVAGVMSMGSEDGTWSLNPDGTTSFPSYNFPYLDGSTDQVLKTDGSGTQSWVDGSVTLGITDVPLGSTALVLDGLTSVEVTQDPVTNLQLATKQYVDNIATTGLTFHDPVYCATIVNVSNVAYNQPGGAGVGVGATLTRTGAFATLSIDGTNPPVGARVLVRLQTTQQWNGVYTVTNVGSPSTAWVLTRATDADTYGSNPGQLSLNDYFYVQNGTTQKGIAYVLNAPTGTITFGTSAITFAEFSSSQVYTGTTPIDVTGTVISLTTVPITLGGTGQTTANAALNALLPTQTANTGKYLSTDGVDTSWQPVSGLSTTYTVDASTTTGGANFNLVGSDATTDTIKFASGTGITVAQTDPSTITVNSTITQYTDADARNAISATGSLTYNSTTGVIDYTTPTTIASLSNHNTDDLVEGSSNLYYTDARARAAVSAGTGISYNSTTGVITNSGVTSAVAGTHITVSSGTGAVTIGTDATDANTASTIVARDASGNFSAGTITANFTNGDRVLGALTATPSTTYVFSPPVSTAISDNNGLDAASSYNTALGNGAQQQLTHYFADTFAGINTTSALNFRTANGNSETLGTVPWTGVAAAAASATASGNTLGSINYAGYATTGFASQIASQYQGGGKNANHNLQIQGITTETLADSTLTISGATITAVTRVSAALASVAVTGTRGQISFTASTPGVGNAIVVTGTNSGTSTGITAGTYFITFTGSTTTATLSATPNGPPITTTPGTTTGLTFTRQFITVTYSAQTYIPFGLNALITISGFNNVTSGTYAAVGTSTTTSVVIGAPSSAAPTLSGSQSISCPTVTNAGSAMRIRAFPLAKPMNSGNRVEIVNHSPETATYKSDQYNFQGGSNAFNYLTANAAAVTANGSFVVNNLAGSTNFLTVDAVKAAFTRPVGLAVYTAAALTAITGAVGYTAAVSNSPTVGGRLAFWDTTNARWSYVSDNTAV